MHLRLGHLFAGGAAWLLLTVPATAHAIDVFVSSARGQSARGQDYHVVSIEIPIADPVMGRTFPPLRVSDAGDRILFPVAADVRRQADAAADLPVPRPGRGRLLGRVGNLIRDLTAPEADREQTVARRILFLARDSGPLRFRLSDPAGQIGEYEIDLATGDGVYRDLIGRWWSAFGDTVHRQIESAKYPPWVESYLVAALASRLSLPLPDWYIDTSEGDDELLNTLSLVAGAGGMAESAFRQAAAGRQATSGAQVALPPPPRWAPMFEASDLDEVPIEPMATRVPPECFYVRFGSFANYLWFGDLSKEYGGDISRMFAVSGISNDSAQRIERQLYLRNTEIARLFGGTLIEDQALIGTDAFLADGASMGVILKTTNAFLMRTSLNSDRSKLAESDESVTLRNVSLGGRQISFLNSADNRVRSYMVEDGPYFLVTNSQTIAERFIEVGKNKESLAATSSFRLARKLMPMERNDSIFAYFSPAMLRGLASPKTLIELRRRLFAKADIALVHLARLSAAAEGEPLESIDALIEAGYLPERFSQRADGSGVVGVGDTVIDTLRGARGTFLPIADVQIDSVTPEEAQWYQAIADNYSTRFPTIDPIMVGIGKQDLPDSGGIQRVTVRAEIAPWEPEKYGWVAEQLGPPTDVAMKFAPDDIVAVQAHVASPQLGPPTHLFAAIKDTVPPPPEQFEGILNIYMSLRQLPGYLGAWPQPGALDRLPLGLGVGQPVGPGLSRLIGGLYRYTGGGFSILSFQADILQASLPFLAATDVEDSAQLRGRVGDLADSQLKNWVNEQLYELVAEGSGAGANFLDLVSELLKIEPDQVLAASSQVLGGDLQCTLGGTYQHSEATGRWYSTAWQGETLPPTAPNNYIAPAMKWFRGADAKVTQYEDRLVADVVIDIQRNK